MSLKTVGHDWMRFGNGRLWRYNKPGWLVETIEPGHVPEYGKKYSYLIPRVKRIRSFYSGRVKLGHLDQYGTGLDVLVVERNPYIGGASVSRELHEG